MALELTKIPGITHPRAICSVIYQRTATCCISPREPDLAIEAILPLSD